MKKSDFKAKVKGIRKLNPIISDTIVLKMNYIEKIEDNYMLIKNKDGNLFKLNWIGEEIWKMIDGKNTIYSIINILCNNYEVDPLECEQTVIDFIRKLEALQLVFLHNI